MQSLGTDHPRTTGEVQTPTTDTKMTGLRITLVNSITTTVTKAITKGPIRATTVATARKTTTNPTNHIRVHDKTHNRTGNPTITHHQHHQQILPQDNLIDVPTTIDNSTMVIIMDNNSTLKHGHAIHVTEKTHMGIYIVYVATRLLNSLPPSNYLLWAWVSSKWSPTGKWMTPW